jgi:hypothetical protein
MADRLSMGYQLDLVCRSPAYTTDWESLIRVKAG